MIQGVQLPEKDADITSIVNNVVLYNDNTFATVDAQGRVITGQIPENGRIKVDDTEIHVSRRGVTYVSGEGGNATVIGTGTIAIGRGAISAGPGGISIGGTCHGNVYAGGRPAVTGRNLEVRLTGSTIVIGNNSPPEYEIDKAYPVKKRDLVSVCCNTGNIALALTDGRSVRVEGNISSEPVYAEGRLMIQELDGTVYMPRRIKDLDILADSKNGTVTGEVIHPGDIASKNGCVTIRLMAPLKVKASTQNGIVSVNGMQQITNEWYTPPGVAKPKGTLSIDSKNGVVTVTYSANELPERHKRAND